jgi:hypothetical protein
VKIRELKEALDFAASMYGDDTEVVIGTKKNNKPIISIALTYTGFETGRAVALMPREEQENASQYRMITS